MNKLSEHFNAFVRTPWFIPTIAALFIIFLSANIWFANRTANASINFAKELATTQGQIAKLAQDNCKSRKDRDALDDLTYNDELRDYKNIMVKYSKLINPLEKAKLELGIKTLKKYQEKRDKLTVRDCPQIKPVAVSKP